MKHTFKISFNTDTGAHTMVNQRGDTFTIKSQEFDNFLSGLESKQQSGSVVPSDENMKVIFTLDNGMTSGEFSLLDIIKTPYDEEYIINTMEPPCSSSMCHTESQNFCDCGPELAENEIIGVEIKSKQQSVVPTHAGYVCSCGTKMVLLGGTVYFTADEEPYKSGEKLELNLEVEEYIHGYYCEECKELKEVWSDKMCEPSWDHQPPKELSDAIKALRMYEAWEPDLILNYESWKTGLPQINQDQFEQWMKIQEFRNKVLRDHQAPKQD